MTSKEKAVEIRNSFIDVTKNFHPEDGWVKDLDSAKRAGIIAVDEIAKECIRIDAKFNLGLEGTLQFWQDVKKELELF